MTRNRRTLLWVTLIALAVASSAAVYAFFAPAHQPPARKAPPPRMELNLIGYQVPGGELGTRYVLPSQQTLSYFMGKGFTTFRLPMDWDRLQPQVNGPLDEAKLLELEAFLDLADANKVQIIADLHHFGGRGGHQLGSSELPVGALASFWGQFAERFAGRFYGYDIMNEPHDMPSPTAWPTAAQQTVDAIRKVDPQTIIFVEGDDWSSAPRWQQSNANLDIRDPADKIVYSAHVYFDKDTSGQYRQSFKQDGVSRTVGAERLRPFVEWLRKKGAKGHIGEYGVPRSDPDWLPVLDAFLDEAAASGDVLVGLSYWGAGEWMDFYDVGIQPDKDGKWTDRPQLAVLMKKR